MAVLALVAAGTPAPVGAQGFFPLTPPSQVFAEDFAGGIDTSVWTVWPTGSGAWSSTTDSVTCYGSGHWDTHLKETGATSGAPTGLLIAQSMPNAPGYDPNQWTNLRMELDLHTSGIGQMGFTWGLQPDSNGDGYPDAGYLFFIDRFATDRAPYGPGNRAVWHLIRREGDINTEIGSASVVLVEGADHLDSMYADSCYRLRIDWFCGNLRVQVRKETFNSACPTGCYAGCNYDGADPETAWCTIARWTESGTVLTPGGAGFYHGSPDPSSVAPGRWDNLVISSWGPDCSICDPWTAWGTGWTTGTETATDRVPFKLLFESVLADYTLTALDGHFKARDDLCSTWHLLANLPDPTASPGSNNAEIQKYLERVSTSKSASDMFTFSDNFDTDNPIPLMYWGQTPIKKTLESAYQWYKDIRGPDGAWSDAADPLSQCRNWYVIFITDGEESCDTVGAGDLPAVCQWLANNESFQNPGAGLDDVPILTIGFSQNVDANSPLSCMSSQTGGQFYAASSATELAAAISNVVNLMDEKDRSFLPVTVSPEPVALGSSFNNEFLLTLPVFVPRNGSSVWDGHYYAFRINPEHPTPPMKDVVDQDGNVVGQVVDTDQAQWDAADQIASQISAGSRKIFYSRASGTGNWSVRSVFTTIHENATRLDEFKTWTGVAADADALEMLSFVDGSSSRRAYPLGDIFHSKPVVVDPPNDFRYFFNNVHGYFEDFMGPQKHRRRVAFVGSNDGLFHAIDAGFYDRDDGGTWDNTFDLGTGLELFAYVPHAVLDPQDKPSVIKTQTFGTEQVYSVDGTITSADVFIDPSGGSSPSWRTVVLFGLRRGGRGVTALDVTQPDRVDSTTGEPVLSTYPGCLNGGTNCIGPYPKPLWEFTADKDTDSDGDGEADLGLTWSAPAVARVKTSSGDAYVAFFGGGMPLRPGDPSDHRGRFFYGLNVATGAIVYKVNIGSPVPGGVAVLDQNDDGFADRIYFGDTAGGLWRLDVTAEATDNGGGSLGTSGWTLTKIYEFDSLEVVDDSGTVTGSTPAMFYMTPKLVPVAFSGGTYTWGIAIGSGNRAQVGKMNGVRNRFYFVLDSGDTQRDESDLQGVDYNASTTGDDTSYFDPANGLFGWYLRFRPNEKTTTDGIIVQERVVFATLEAVPPGTTGEGLCAAGGQGRIYQVYYTNVNPVNDTRDEETAGGLIGGGASFTVGETTISWWTHMDVGATSVTMGQRRFHRTTNWRQE